MALAIAKGRFVKVPARKARWVINLVNGKSVNEAEAILSNLNKVAAGVVLKVVKSAAANAKQQKNLKPEDLYISKMYADEAPSLKRYKAQAMGRAAMILRRYSHIVVELEAKKAAETKKMPPVKKALPAKKRPVAKKIPAKAKRTKQTGVNTRK
ncbi:MAG: 50S ribosomal protein L22 [Candidatus Omnitrophota bacterium]